MAKKEIVIFVVVLVIVGALFFWQSRNSGLKVGEDGQGDLERLVTLAFIDYAGRSVSLAEFSGKPLVVNSWAVWCPFCVEELKDFAELQEEFREHIAVIAIDRAEPLETTRSFTDNLGVTDKMNFWLDPEDQFYRTIGGFGMPETLFINAQGQITTHKRGPMDFEEMRQKVVEII
jgi:thiol-disulfide isomerase/thioredoxin